MSESERGWERVGEGGREWESGRVRVRKPLRTAKEPALVFVQERVVLRGFPFHSFY